MHRRQFLRSAVTLGTAITLPAAFYKSAFSANLPAEITGFTAIQLSDAIRLRTVSCSEVVIIPFLTNFKSRSHAVVSICFGGKPPLALLGRSFIPPNLERHW